MKNVEFLSFASADELARAAASAWLDAIESANRAGKLHSVALSGGRITQKFFTAAVEQAKATRTKTMAGATEQRKVSDARNEASHAKQEADSRVAMERCDAMSGDAKERCRADAKKMISK